MVKQLNVHVICTELEYNNNNKLEWLVKKQFLKKDKQKLNKLTIVF